MSAVLCLSLSGSYEPGGFFFFSSRRRHTRCSRDWSSDVCSSDLAAVKWVAVRYGSLALQLAGLPPNAGLGTVAQGGAAIAMGLNFLMTYGGVGGGGVLTTVVLGVATAQLVAPPLMGLALRSTIASPAAPAPLTPIAAPAELGANAPADWPR